MPDYATLRVIWWLILGALLIGFAVMDGFDLGRRRDLSLPRPHRRGAPRVARVDRAGLGRQPGLVHPRRWRGVRRLAAAVRGILLRACIWRCSCCWWRSSCARWDSSFATSCPIRAGATPGTGRCSSAARCRRCCSGWRSAICSSACRFTSTSCSARCLPAASSDCCDPFALLAGLVSLSMLVMHGAVYAALKVGPPMSARAGGARAHHRAWSYIAAFIVRRARGWQRLDGHRIGCPSLITSAPPIPLAKQVARRSRRLVCQLPRACAAVARAAGWRCSARVAHPGCCCVPAARALAFSPAR